MDYTVQQLGKLAGVSSRTLRYYDEIGLLKPARLNASGYRIYSGAEVDRLQQILFYRELGINLEQIGAIIDAPSFDALSALREHRKKLLEQRAGLDLLIANVEKTIAANEGSVTMRDQEKFEGFKRSLIAENEKQYGAEIRSKYGNAQIDHSNGKIKAMSETEYMAVEKLGAEVIEAFKAAFATGNPAGEPAQKAADLHRQWLECYWDRYNSKAHAGLAQMYMDDPRFAAYYDQTQPGLTMFLRDAVMVYTQTKV